MGPNFRPSWTEAGRSGGCDGHRRGAPCEVLGDARVSLPEKWGSLAPGVQELGKILWLWVKTNGTVLG